MIFSSQYLPLILVNALNASYILLYQQKNMMAYLVESAIHYFISPYFTHSYFIYTSTYYVNQLSSMVILRAITGDFYILKAFKAFQADCYKVTKFAKDKVLGSILQLESVSFLIVNGVLIPWDCLPKPYPILNPCFCIILKANLSPSSNAWVSTIGCSIVYYYIYAPFFSYYAIIFDIFQSSSLSFLLFLPFLIFQNIWVQWDFDCSYEFGCAGSYYISISRLLLGCSCVQVVFLEFYTTLFKSIFFVLIMLFSLEFMLARLNFFLSPYVLELADCVTG